MGICIRGDYEGSPQWDMGYSSFYQLRRDVAYFVSDEFGAHYADIIYSANCPEEYDSETERLIKKYKIPARLLDFLYLPDAEARLSPLKCKAVYDCITYSKPREDQLKKLYGYRARPNDCMKLVDFLDLLLECYNRRKYLVWR